ncbi:MAG: hypothetical protein QOJ05_397 [Verrucomicrobiota bacterium]|jgi:hypothetical protein
MPAEPKHLLRALALLWARLGSLRIYLAAIAAVVLALAVLGFWHLISPRKELAPAATAIARVSPGVAPSLSRPAVRDGSPSAILNPPSSPSSTPALARAIAITEVKETIRRGMRGEILVVATIAMTPQTTAEKEKVEIDVSFFDLDRENQMHPTDAQITYEWLTPDRDWTEPAPKYLAATYLQPRPFRRGPDQLRYGGFIVRIYSDGQLQDQRSKPETLIASLRSNAPSPAPPDTSSISPSLSATPLSRPAPRDESPTPSARSSQNSQQPTLNSPPSEAPLPNGIPIPGKPGFVQSPYDPKFIIDVRGFPPGTLVNDPNTNKPFRVP